MIIACASFTSCANDRRDGKGEGEQPPVIHDNLPEAVAFAQTLGIGWNLGNNLDAWNGSGVAQETAWGNALATQKAFDVVKKTGFRSVRIPVTWLGHVGAAPAYTIEKAWLDRVAQVVGYAHNAGLKVIINIHHDGHADGGKADKYTWLDVAKAAQDETVNTAIKQRLTAMWTQIANRFQNEDDWLIFETLNEIHDGNWGDESKMINPQGQYRVLNEWNQTVVDAIRATGGKNATRYIGIPSYVTQPGKAIDKLVMPADKVKNRLMVAVHSYDPWDYAGSGKYSEWGHNGNVAAYKNGEKEYVQMLDGLSKKFVKAGIPVYFGEFACVHRSSARAELFRKYYLEYVCKAMRDRHIVALYWDNGYAKNDRNTDDDVFGLINHSTGQYLLDGEEIAKVMINAWENNDKSYTLESVYNRAP